MSEMAKASGLARCVFSHSTHPPPLAFLLRLFASQRSFGCWYRVLAVRFSILAPPTSQTTLKGRPSAR